MDNFAQILATPKPGAQVRFSIFSQLPTNWAPSEVITDTNGPFGILIFFFAIIFFASSMLYSAFVDKFVKRTYTRV
jgi:hypothetical protein